MKERPILFNAEMVRAILDGRKTQTRRVVKVPQPMPGAGFRVYQSSNGEWFFERGDIQWATFKCPFGKPGDRLWVKETWGWFTPNWDGIEWVPDRPFKEVREKKFGQGYVDGNLIWAADGSFAWADEDSMEERSAWKPSIHMPRWASRITLEIKSVRIERLQDISNDDAKSEGFDSLGADDFPHASWSPRQVFGKTWVSLYGEESWQQNPWVWVIEFERVG
nr:hypothetical protein CKG001_10520 [Bdellovibrio sp. CKG001]